jgi:ribosome-binding ATPase YchF (GTP1/OBG family)
VRVEDIGEEFGVKSQPRHGFIMGKYRFVPVEVVDVAGLIPGAHLGKGLGNQFMNDLIRADVLLHIVDLSGSTDAQGNFVGYGKHDPEEDIKWLEEEITLWILGIIERNRKKIEATIKNSREFLRIVEEFGSFDNYIWGFVNGKPVVNNWRESEKLPAETPLSKKISVDLKKRGFLFVGPIVVYSYMQAVGIVEDHYEYCFRKGEI